MVENGKLVDLMIIIDNQIDFMKKAASKDRTLANLYDRFVKFHKYGYLIRYTRNAFQGRFELCVYVLVLMFHALNMRIEQIVIAANIVAKKHSIFKKYETLMQFESESYRFQEYIISQVHTDVITTNFEAKQDKNVTEHLEEKLKEMTLVTIAEEEKAEEIARLKDSIEILQK